MFFQYCYSKLKQIQHIIQYISLTTEGYHSTSVGIVKVFYTQKNVVTLEIILTFIYVTKNHNNPFILYENLSLVKRSWTSNVHFTAIKKNATTEYTEAI